MNIEDKVSVFNMICLGVTSVDASYPNNEINSLVQKWDLL